MTVGEIMLFLIHMPLIHLAYILISLSIMHTYRHVHHDLEFLKLRSLQPHSFFSVWTSSLLESCIVWVRQFFLVRSEYQKYVNGLNMSKSDVFFLQLMMERYKQLKVQHLELEKKLKQHQKQLKEQRKIPSISSVSPSASLTASSHPTPSKSGFI